VVPARYLYFLRNALACHAPLYCREYDCRSERELGILYLQIASLNESHKLPDLIRLCFPSYLLTIHHLGELPVTEYVVATARPENVEPEASTKPQEIRKTNVVDLPILDAG
jgi:hypothetical protein